jgi:hypothetical protein
LAVKNYIREKEGISELFSHIRKKNKNKKDFITTITTNYDGLIEWNLLEDGEAIEAWSLIDYGFSWRETNDKMGEVYFRPKNALFKIFKLHGSVDWLKCERCGHIYLNPTEPIYKLAFNNKKTEANSCHCGFWPLKPVIVTPSYVRNVFDTNLHEIWKASVEALREANEWVIIGYSLPNEDLNIKGLFLRALYGREKPPSITVVQHGNDAERRFINFFGSDCLTYLNEGLEGYVTQLTSKPTRSTNKIPPTRRKVKK